MKYQHGAVMIEMAYVLPLVLGVTLFTGELISYALNSFVVNDVVTSMHTSILSDVSDVSNWSGGGVLDTTFAECSGSNKVVLKANANTTISNLVTSALATKNITFLSSSPATIVVTKSVISGFDVYVINFTGATNSLILPEYLEVLLPIRVNTIVSIKESCV